MPEDFNPWSVTKAKIAHNCSLRFNWQYVNKVPGKKVERAEGRIGKAVHQILERMLLGHTWKKAFFQAALDASLTRTEMQELDTFKDSVHRFLDRFSAFCEKNNVSEDEIYVEHDLLVFRDLTSCDDYWEDDLWIRGVVDVGVRVIRNEDPYMIIIDHKTGRPREIDEYMTQLRTYAVMTMGVFPDVAGVQAAIHWPRAEDPKDVFSWGPMWPKEYVLETLYPWLSEYLGEAAAKGLADPTPQQGWYCDYCQFRYRCPLQGSEVTAIT